MDSGQRTQLSGENRTVHLVLTSASQADTDGVAVEAQRAENYDFNRGTGPAGPRHTDSARPGP